MSSQPSSPHTAHVSSAADPTLRVSPPTVIGLLLEQRLQLADEYHLTPESLSQGIALLDKLEKEIQSLLSKTVLPDATTPDSTSTCPPISPHSISVSEHNK